MSILLKRSAEAVIVLGITLGALGAWEVTKEWGRAYEEAAKPVDFSFVKGIVSEREIDSWRPVDAAKFRAEMRERQASAEKDVRETNLAKFDATRGRYVMMYLACGLGVAISTGVGALMIRSSGSHQPTISRLRPNPNP